MLVAKTDLSSIPKTHMEEGKNQFSLSSDFSAHTVARVSSTQTDTQINKVQWKKKKGHKVGDIEECEEES